MAPAESKPGGSTFAWAFDANWPYGTYPTRICADVFNSVTERDETNNCKKLHPFYVVPKAFEGGISGAAQLLAHAGVTLRWRGTVKFDISHGAPHGNEGLFDYRFVDGTLTYTVEGRSGPGGCTWSGAGQYTPSGHHDINVAFGRVPHYSAKLDIDPNFHFPVTIACPSESRVMDFYPLLWGGSSWLRTGTLVRHLKDPGLTHLRGRYMPFDHIGWRWNLEATP